MLLKEVARICGSAISDRREVKGFEIDSRRIQQGMLFFALKGEKTDGHLHLKGAMAKGAIAAIVEKGFAGTEEGLKLIRVDDVASALKKLAQGMIRKKEREIIAITGSIGKTTTKDFIADLLGKKYKVFKTPASFNSQLGFPTAILNMDQEAQMLVLEMGMSKRKDISNLIEIAPPDIAVITRISYSHAAHFEDGISGIAAAKAEILASPRTHLALVHRESERFAAVFNAYGAKRLDFSMDDPKSHFYLEEKGDEIEFFEDGKALFKCLKPFKERHFLENCLAAIAIARMKGLSIEEIVEGLSALKTPKMRFEKFEKNGVLLINDAYNSTLESALAAIKSLKHYKGRKIAVLGAMKELGEYSKMAHEAVALCAMKEVDELFCLGDETRPMVEIFKEEKRDVHFFSDLGELSSKLQSFLKKGDVVLIKGSRSLAMEKIFTLLKFEEFCL